MEDKLITEYTGTLGGTTWNRKMRTFFRRLDVTGKGYLMVDDILDIVSEILNAFPKMETYENDELVNAMVNFWYEILSDHGDENSKTAAMITQDKFLENLNKGVNGKFRENFEEKFVTPLFASADGDKDGLITSMEFRNLFVALRAPKTDCETVFKVNVKGGKMDKDKFHKVLADFFASDNNKSPNAKLFGPLVNYKTAAEYPEVQFSPTWEGKMRTMFRRLDIGQTGVLRCHNFIQIARSLAQRNHLDKRRATDVMKCMLNIWVKFIAVDSSVFETGKAGKHFSQLTERDFVQNLRQMINGDFRHEIDQFGWTFFKAVESDGDGYLKMNEYRSLQESWNVGREEAEGMFKVLDRDKDNMISADEYLNAWVEYFLGEDHNSPFKAFFGPVIIRHQDNRTQFNEDAED